MSVFIIYYVDSGPPNGYYSTKKEAKRALEATMRPQDIWYWSGDCLKRRHQCTWNERGYMDLIEGSVEKLLRQEN